ncbi:uncharacterized protein IL334_007347 [Kwoniella shivajii]|uniref:Palmitoyltransferase n=1 Tax=Kwoniella shivajii TaxID=564305 RepID=A0ABZ1DA99_9TREE|nr:hypothetical protein IL334_007347 [Kwoniella shivajii]
MAGTAVWLLQQLIPPLLLTYFYFGWKITTFETPQIYRTLPTLLVGSITIVYLRLYFLSSTQSTPPYDPPPAIRNRKIIFQCLSPSEAKALRLANDAANQYDEEPMVERCHRDRCGGRWKPARTRHCSMCQRCRGGWDHHCPFFANCLTAQYMRSFLALLLYTPPTVLLLSLPLYKPLCNRAIAAYAFSRSSDEIRQYWWDWSYSWVIAGGPIGRYAGGMILGWRELDKMDNDKTLRLGVGLMIGFGVLLALVTTGLAFSTITLLVRGNLTIDKGRSTAHNQALHAIYKSKMSGRSIPPELEMNLKRFSDTRHFYVPFPESFQNNGKEGIVLPILDHERPYDHGWKKNLEIVLGKGWAWLLPWNAMQRGMGDEMFSWPIEEGVKNRLMEEAERIALEIQGDS